jgi:glycosyltransferase involved in cell wall biosynthesis
MNRKVSFLMPVAAPAPFLAETLESVLAQSFEDWSLTAVLDGHSVEVEDLIRASIPSDRLTLVRLRKKQGISRALNAGLRATGAELVARIDADDVNLPDRLRFQVEFMDRSPDVAIVGGAALLIDEHGDVLGQLAVRSGSDIRKALLIKNRLVHSSVMFRRDAVQGIGGYNARCLLREDYELWLRLAAEGPVANIPEAVVMYRLNEGQISRRSMPAGSGAYVAAARRDAARAVGIPSMVAKGISVAWTAAQRDRIKSRLGALRRQRKRHGLA